MRGVLRGARRVTKPAALIGTPTPTPPPTFTTAPTIAGPLTVGQALSAATYGDGVVTNGAINVRTILLAGVATVSTYVLQTGDVGKTVAYRNDATGPGGTAASTSGTITVAAAAAALLPIGTPIITIGPSIQNVVNMRSPRMHMIAASKGHLYPTPGTNQATGGASALTTGTGGTTNYYEHPTRIDTVMKQLGDPAARGKVLVQYDPGPNDVFNLGTVGAPNVTDLVAALDRWIARITGAGHSIMLSPVLDAAQFASNASAQAGRQAFNAAMQARHNPAQGIFYCGSRLAATDGQMAAGVLTYDGLHPNWKGAQIIGYADWGDLSAYLAAGSIWTSIEAYLNPYGQAANAKGALGGTGGTASAAGGGASGVVADGWAIYCNTTGTAAGAATGVTATCSKGPVKSLTVNGQTFNANQQIVRVQGNATAAGFLTFVTAIGKGSNWNEGDFGYGAFLHELYGATPDSAPVGVASRAEIFGLLGKLFNKTPDANAGLAQAATGLVGGRSVPESALRLQANQGAELTYGWLAGATVDFTLVIYQFQSADAEMVAYAAPHNLSAAFPAGNNPLTRRPALTGSLAVGGTATMNGPTVSGGGRPARTSYIRDAANAVITSKAQNASAHTYVWLAGDSGKTVRETVDVASNGFGGLTVDDGPTYAVTG